MYLKRGHMYIYTSVYWNQSQSCRPTTLNLKASRSFTISSIKFLRAIACLTSSLHNFLGTSYFSWWFQFKNFFWPSDIRHITSSSDLNCSWTLLVSYYFMSTSTILNRRLLSSFVDHTSLQ